MKAKLAAATGRVERLAKEEKPIEAKVRELYLAAFSREPRPQELKTAIEYLNEPGSAANANYQDLILGVDQCQRIPLQPLGTS